MRAARGLVWWEPPAKSQTASRSCLLTAQRKVTALCLPDWRVDGAAPARQISDSGSGNRPRQLPISVSSRAARTVPERGRIMQPGARFAPVVPNALERKAGEPSDLQRRRARPRRLTGTAFGDLHVHTA